MPCLSYCVSYTELSKQFSNYKVSAVYSQIVATLTIGSHGYTWLNFYYVLMPMLQPLAMKYSCTFPGAMPIQKESNTGGERTGENSYPYSHRMFAVSFSFLLHAVLLL